MRSTSPAHHAWRGCWRLGAALAVCALSLGHAVQGWAFEPMRSPGGAMILRWPAGHEHRLCSRIEDPDTTQAARLGAAIWWTQGGATAPLSIDPEPVGCALDPLDGATAVVELRDAAGWPGGVVPGDTVVGYTVHTWDHTTGILSDADIALNAARYVFDAGVAADAFDSGWVVAHEMGHVLGLGHPCGYATSALPSCYTLSPADADRLTEALMFPASAPGPRRPALAADDLAGLASVLGPLGEAPSAPAFCSSPDSEGTSAPADDVVEPHAAERWQLMTSSSASRIGLLSEDLTRPDGEGPLLALLWGPEGAFALAEMPADARPCGATGPGIGKGCACRMRAASTGAQPSIILWLAGLVLLAQGWSRACGSAFGWRTARRHPDGESEAPCND